MHSCRRAMQSRRHWSLLIVASSFRPCNVAAREQCETGDTRSGESVRHSIVRKVLRLLAAAAVGLTIGSIILAENALRVPPHERDSLAYAQAFAKGASASAEAMQIRAADGSPLDAWLFAPAQPNGAGAI